MTKYCIVTYEESTSSHTNKFKRTTVEGFIIKPCTKCFSSTNHVIVTVTCEYRLDIQVIQHEEIGIKYFWSFHYIYIIYSLYVHTRDGRKQSLGAQFKVTLAPYSQ